MFSAPRLRLLICSLCLGALSGLAKPGMILDTDFRSDCDDAGALAVFHALADKGECTALAVIASTTGPHVVGAIDAVNTFYGRPQMPVGLNPKRAVSGGDQFAQALAENFPSKLTNADAPESTKLYRKLLHAAPKQSVTIAVVGAQSCVAMLLKSAADHEGDGSIGVSGRDLVREKVKELVVMGGNFETGGGEWNIMLDVDAANLIATEWPGPVVYTGAEIGGRILTGGKLTDPEKNPVALAYKLSPHTIGGAGKIGGRWSWDQTAVYYGVRGVGEEPLWRLSDPIKVTFTKQTTAVTPFDGEPSREQLRRHLLEQAPRIQMEKTIEALMLQSPRS